MNQSVIALQTEKSFHIMLYVRIGYYFRNKNVSYNYMNESVTALATENFFSTAIEMPFCMCIVSFIFITCRSEDIFSNR